MHADAETPGGEAYLGADLGGTHFRVGLRRRGELRLLDQEWVTASGAWDAERLLDQMGGMVDRIQARHPGLNLAGIGFGSTGDIDCAGGVCYSMKRFPGLEEAPLRRLLEERWGVPAALLNDGLCAALGELRAGAGRGVDDFVMITLGTGIGGGVVVGGRVLAGSRGRIGKVGHQILDLDGPVHCHCGLRGCWQSLAGKEAIELRARGVAAAVPESRLAALLRAEPDPDLRQVTELALSGDGAALEVVEGTGWFVGIGLANLVKLFAPQRVVVGGGIAEGNPVLLEFAQRALDEYAIKPYQHVPLVPAELGKEAGLLGATLLAEFRIAD